MMRLLSAEEANAITRANVIGHDLWRLGIRFHGRELIEEGTGRILGTWLAELPGDMIERDGEIWLREEEA